MAEKVNDRWIDENGNDVFEYTGFSKVYTDDISRSLTYQIDMNTFPDCSLLSSLGKTEFEISAFKILMISKLYRKIVGIERTELENYLASIESSLQYSPGYFEQNGLLRLKKVRGIQVLFPTEELLIKQDVKKK